MSIAFTDAFVESAQEVFRLMLDTSLEPAMPGAAREPRSGCAVSGLIGLNGACRGTIVVGLDDVTALNISEAMLGVRAAELGPDVLDVVAELTNMIAGGGKTRLKQLDVTLGLPMVICGAGQSVAFPVIALPQKIELESKLGGVQLYVGIARANAGAAKPI